MFVSELGTSLQKLHEWMKGTESTAWQQIQRAKGRLQKLLNQQVGEQLALFEKCTVAKSLQMQWRYARKMVPCSKLWDSICGNAPKLEKEPKCPNQDLHDHLLSKFMSRRECHQIIMFSCTLMKLLKSHLIILYMLTPASTVRLADMPVYSI